MKMKSNSFASVSFHQCRQCKSAISGHLL